MILVDSSVWIDFFNGVQNRETDLLDVLLNAEPVGIGDLIYLEVLQGFTEDQHFNKAKKLLDCLPLFPLCNKNLASKGAEYYRMLRKKGITIRKTIDTVIATFCIENDFALLHSDKDFEPFVRFAGLKTL